MKTGTIKANCLELNNRCELLFNDAHGFSPVAKCAASRLADFMRSYADDAVVVSYRTVSDAGEQAKDERKYSKRIESLGSDWAASPWRMRTFNGHTLNVVECELRYIGEAR